MDDLVALAKNLAEKGEDLYAKFDVQGRPGPGPPAAALDEDQFQKSVQRSWRKKALRYHPDKAGEDYNEALYRSLERARDVLLDPAARKTYDDAVAAALRQKLERDKLSGHRRQLLDDLERRERDAELQQRGRKRAGAPEPPAAVSAEQAEYLRQQREGGRRIKEERERLIREAEARERARRAQGPSDGATMPAVVVDEDYDSQIADLERRLAEKKKRRADRRARKSGAEPDVQVRVQVQAQADAGDFTLQPPTATHVFDQFGKAHARTPIFDDAGHYNLGPLMAKLRAAQALREARRQPTSL